MKKLTKAAFKKMIKAEMKAGRTSFEAFEALSNEYEMYQMVIMAAHTDILLESL